MTTLYAIALGVGSVALISWVGATVVASSVPGREGIHPDRRFGRTGRWVVAGLCGAGMAGLSGSYAGWPAWAAFAAAVAGGAGLGWIATVADGVP